MNPVQMFYNNPYFENLQETKPFKKYLDREEKKVREAVEGGIVLDVGCGNGRSTRVINDVSEKVMGLDFSERLIEQAKKNLPEIKFYLEDAKSIHFDNNSFDYVVMLWNTFGDLYSSRNQVLNEAKRVLRPEGKILMGVLSENALEPYLAMVTQNKLVVLQHDDNYIFLREGLVSERFSEKKLERICKEAGLTFKIKKLTDISYWCEAQKHSL